MIILLPILVFATSCVDLPSSSNESSSSLETMRLITNQAELSAISDDLDFTYELANDITLTGAWTSIGTKLNPFIGNFSGNGHSISGLSLDVASVFYEPIEEIIEEVTVLNSTGYLGLFGFNGGIIENLMIDDVSITGTGIYGGALVPTEMFIQVGGLAGVNTGTIRHVQSSGSIDFLSTDARVKAGGLVGLNDGGTIQSCESSVAITVVTNTNKAAVGGIVGESEGTDAVLSLVKATGDVISTMNSDDPNVDEFQAYAGGIVGVLQGGSLTNAFASGDATSSINAAKPSYAGGVVGTFDNEFSNLTLSNVYASGAVSATSLTTPKAYAGGILGRYEDKTFGFTVVISNVLSSSAVVANTLSATKAYSGTLIGDFNLTNSTFTNGYYAGTATFTGKSNGTLPISGATETTLNDITVQMMGWDAEIWSIQSGVLNLVIA